MSKELQILLLEDRAADAELMLHGLRQDGFRCQAKRVWTEADFVAELGNPALDLILADYSLPSFDGLSALKLAREQRPELPFILVSGSLGEERAVQALQEGATDYVLKQRLLRLGPAVRRALGEAEERNRRQKAEEELRRHERNYREIFDTTHDAIFVHDTVTGEVLDVNQTMLDMFGYTREDLSGLMAKAFQGTEAYSQEEALRRMRLASTEGPQVFEWRNRRKNGELFWTEVALRATTIGGAGRVLAVVRDITERKQAQAALLRAKEDWERTFDAVPDLIAIIDANHRIIRANRAMAQRLGTTPDQCVGLTCYQVVHGTAAPPDFCPHAKLLRDGQEHAAEVSEPRLGGDFHVSTSPLFDAAGQLTGSVHVARDITESKRTEAALRASEATLHRAQAVAQVGSWRLDFLSKALEWSVETYRIFGVAVDTPVNREGFLARVHPEDRALIARAWQEATAGKPYDVEHRIVVAGDIRWVRERAELEFDEAGQPRTGIGTVQDITARKEAEMRIRHLNQLLAAVRDINKLIVREREPQRLLQEACTILLQTRGYLLVWIGCPDPQSTRVLPQASAGARADYLEHITVTFDDSPTGQGPVGTALRTRQPWVCQDITTEPSFASWRALALERGYRSMASMPMLHGERVFGAINVYADRPAAFTPEEIGLLEETANDLAFALQTIEHERERQIAEEQLRAQARLLDLATDAIVVRDLNDCVQYWNQGATNLYGWSALEAMGRPVTELCWLDQEAFRKAKGQLLLTGQWTGEARQRAQDGRELVVNCRWTLVRDAQGQPQAVLAINTDLTEKKSLETRFLRAQRLESVGQLASGIAHDLNNILTPVIMGATLLREAMPDPEMLSLIDTMEASALRGADIIKQILAFSRGLPGARSPLPSGRLFKEITGLTRETFPRSITTEATLARDLWLVEGDATQLHQVLLNLCVNARDAMPDGGTLRLTAANVQLDAASARRIPGGQPGPCVEWRVADTGQGIPPEVLDRIFDPFFTTKEIGKGTGLGLATVLGIVRSHGGWIEVTSTVGQGTEFRILLPAVVEAPAAPPVAPGPPVPPAQGELILVVDDEVSLRQTIQRTLEKHGYRVLLAQNGAEALGLFAQHSDQIALVLTDMDMPGQRGDALLRAIHRLRPTVRTICMSGHPRHEGLDPARSAFLAKPFTSQQLQAALQEALKAK